VTTLDNLKITGAVVALLMAAGAALDFFLIHGKRQSRIHSAACDAWLKFDDTPVEELYLLMAHWPARAWQHLTKGDRVRAGFYGCLYSFALTDIAVAMAAFQERRGDPNVWRQLYDSAFQIPAAKLALNLPGDLISVLFTAYVLQRLSLLYGSRAPEAAAQMPRPTSSSTQGTAVLLLASSVAVAGVCAFLSFALLGIDHAVDMGFLSRGPRTDLGVRYWERFFASLKEWFALFPSMRVHTWNYSLATFLPIATYAALLGGLILAKPILKVLKSLGLSIGDRILTDVDGSQHAKKFQPFKAASYVLSVFAAVLSLCSIVLQAVAN
jgi:hypothetical protein